VGELRIVWDMFTMVRGELFHAFIHLADKRLSVPTTRATQHYMSQAWLSAIMSHTETEENILGRVSVLVGRDTTKMGWDQVSLQYAVPWPLHLVVTPTALEKYNLNFGFLLLVRRT
jgi:gamma-tubulin complex component 4